MTSEVAPVAGVGTARAWPGFQVNPLLDLSAYAFGWAWVLVPLAFTGPKFADYLPLFLLTLGVSMVHRHYTLPYVYLDAQVLRRFPLRFLLLPVVLVAALVAMPMLRRTPEIPLRWLTCVGAWFLLFTQVMALEKPSAPSQEFHASRYANPRIRPRSAPLGPVWPALLFGVASLALLTRLPWLVAVAALVASMIFQVWRRSATTLAIALLVGWTLSGLHPSGVQFVAGERLVDAIALGAGIWNIHHVYMQKYGLLRMYDGLSGGGGKPILDRLLVLSPLPLVIAILPARHKATIAEELGGADGLLGAIVEKLIAVDKVTIPLGALFLVTVLVLFCRHERTRRPSWGRWLFAIGCVALTLLFLVMNPVKVFIAFGFGHAVEYMVFVWAFLRKKYAKPLPSRPILQRVLKHPKTAYFVFTVGLGASFLIVRYTGIHFLKTTPRFSFFGIHASEWLAAWGVLQSLQHFYYDGFLWKLRDKEVSSILEHGNPKQQGFAKPA